jgi:hypothetical protein
LELGRIFPAEKTAFREEALLRSTMLLAKRHFNLAGQRAAPGGTWEQRHKAFLVVTFFEEILIFVLVTLHVFLPKKHFAYFSFHFVKKDSYLSAPSILVVHVLLAIERKVR